MVSDSNTPSDGEDRRHRPPRPGKSVDPEKSLNMAESFEVFTDEIRALNSTMRKMSSDIKNTLDMQARYTTDRKRQNELYGARDSVADHPAETGDATMGVGRNAMNMWNWQQQHRMSGQDQSGLSMGPSFDYFIDPGQRLTGTEGTQSLSHFKTWMAQTLGEKVAGHRQVFNPDLLGGESGGEALHERPGLSRFRSRLLREERKKGREQDLQEAEQEDQETATYQEPISDDIPSSEEEEYQPRHARPEGDDPGRTTGKNVRRSRVSDPKTTDYTKGSSETLAGPEVDPDAGRVAQEDLDSETSRIRDSERPEDSDAGETPPASPKGVSTAGEQPTVGQTTPDGVQDPQRPYEPDDRAGQVRPRDEDHRPQAGYPTPRGEDPTTAAPGVETDPGVGQTRASDESPQGNEVRAEQQSPTAGQTSEDPGEEQQSPGGESPGTQSGGESPGIPTDPNAGQVTPREKGSVADGESQRASSAQPGVPTDSTTGQTSSGDIPGGGSSQTDVPGSDPVWPSGTTQSDYTTGYVTPDELSSDASGETPTQPVGDLPHTPEVSDPRQSPYAHGEPGDRARSELPEGPDRGSTEISDSESPESDSSPEEYVGRRRATESADPRRGTTDLRGLPEPDATDSTSGQTSSDDIGGDTAGQSDAPGSGSSQATGATQADYTAGYVTPGGPTPGDSRDQHVEDTPQSQGVSDPRQSPYAHGEPGERARGELPEGPAVGSTEISDSESTESDSSPEPYVGKRRATESTDPRAGTTGPQNLPEPDVPGSDPVWPSKDIPSDYTAGYTTPGVLASDDDSSSGTPPAGGTPEKTQGVSDPRTTQYSQAEPGEAARGKSPEGPAIGSTSISGAERADSEAGEDSPSESPGGEYEPRHSKPYVGKRRAQPRDDNRAGQTIPSGEEASFIDGTPEHPHAEGKPGEDARQATQDGPPDGSTTVSGHEPYVGKRRAQPDVPSGDSPRASDPRESGYSQREPGEEARRESPDGPADGATTLSDSETPDTGDDSVSEESESEITSRPVRSRIPKVGKHRDEQQHDPNAGQTSPETLAGGAGGGDGEIPEEGAVAEGEEGGGGIPPGGFAAAGAMFGGGGAQGGLSAARTRIGSAIAQSGGTGAGLSMALRRMPVVGLGIEAVSQGAQFYQNQREQGRQYQSMTGTSGAEGWVDKRREDLHRWQNFFKFDGGRSREQFQTVTAAGYNDQGEDSGIMSQSREGALNFMDKSYHEVGMDTGESGQHLDAAARNTFTPLNELVDVLGRLSESAGEAGINAEKARENFGNMFSSITQMGYGESALGGASILSQTQANLGKQFEDTDMSAMYSPTSQMLAASQSGMSYGEVQNLALTDPEGYLSQVSGAQQDIMGAIDPEVQAAIEELSAGKDLSSEAEVQSVRDELLERFPEHDWNTKAMVASEFTGMQMGPEQYITWAIKTYGGHGMDEAIAEEQEHSEAMESGSASEIAGAGGSGAQKSLQDESDPGAFSYFFPKGDTELQGKSNEEASEKLKQWYEEGDEGERGFGQLSEKEEYEAASALEMSDWGSENKSIAESAWGGIVKDFTRGQAAESQYMTGATNQYFEKYTKKGKGDPFLESLLQETKDHDSKVKVPIAGGGERVVSLEEAVQHYGAQLSSGEVEFVEGDLAGKTTAEVAGMEGTGELEDAGDENTTQENLDEMGVGESYERWAEENPEEAEKIREREESGGGEGGESGSTMIDLTPEAKRIFQIQSGEGDPAAATGTPNDPSAGQVNQRGGTSFPLGN